MTSAVVVVHEDRKTQRALSRTLGVTRVPVEAAANAAEACARLEADAGVLAVMSATSCEHETLRIAGPRAVLLSDLPRPRALAMVREREVHHLVGGHALATMDEILATVQKLLRRDVFGLEKYLGWCAATWDTRITRTRDRVRAVAELRHTLEQVGVPRRAVQHAALIADELLSNAVHNAPVDEHGVPYMREESREVERELAPREQPRLRWAVDGRCLAIEVTDAYGTLATSDIRHHVGKLASRNAAIRRDSAGAGLGLAMAYDAANQLVFNISPGRRCQVIGLVDVALPSESAAAPLPSLHVFEVSPDE